MSVRHLINANIHRAKEGARVLEDMARFLFRDEKLFMEFRKIRHGIRAQAPVDTAESDLGGVQLSEKNVRHNIMNIIQANALRIQEALRVLEELSRTESEKQQMKALRYQTYNLHFSLYDKAKKYLKLYSLRGLYPVIDIGQTSGCIEKKVHIINQSPVHIVQYRNKAGSKRKIYSDVKKIKALMNPEKLLIVNDHIDIAMAHGDGVHIGQNDYPIEHVRNIMPEDFILGVSCHNLDEVYVAEQSGASYIAVGSLFPTMSKENVIPINFHTLQRICNETKTPVCGIGGITALNLDQVIASGVRMVAAISCIWKSEDPLQVIGDMHTRITTELTAC